MTEEELRAAHVGEPARLDGPIKLVDYDPAWPQLFAREAERVRAALGHGVLVLEHVGSTSVPGLAAKPWIDMLLVVADSVDEAAYVPALEAAGYVLHIREPNWYEHRMFKRSHPGVHLHVFSPECPEIERMLLFRDWLRDNEADRHLYERTKRELARRTWAYGQHYADAKSPVVEEIIARAQRGDGSDPDGGGESVPAYPHPERDACERHHRPGVGHPLLVANDQPLSMHEPVDESLGDVPLLIGRRSKVGSGASRALAGMTTPILRLPRWRRR